MDKHILKAEKRKLEGRKVKQLRKAEILPANIFGKDFKSVSIQLPIKDFQKVFEKAGETGVIELSVGEETYPVLIHNLQVHPVTNAPLHVDFHKISLKEKVKATVALETIGESPAVEQKIGLLLTPVSEVEVEALPQDLPEKIEIDISGLKEVGNEIKLKDVKVDEKVSILSDLELVVVKIDELITEEAKKEMEAEKAAAEAAAAASGAEAAPAEGEAPTAQETPKEPASAEATAGKEEKPQDNK